MLDRVNDAINCASTSLELIGYQLSLAQEDDVNLFSACVDNHATMFGDVLGQVNRDIIGRV